jgi:hypothetical protein
MHLGCVLVRCIYVNRYEVLRHAVTYLASVEEYYMAIAVLSYCYIAVLLSKSAALKCKCYQRS